MFRGYIQLDRPVVRKLSGTRLFGQTSWNPSIPRMSSTTNWLVGQQKGNWQSFVRQAMGERWPMVHQTNPKMVFQKDIHGYPSLVAIPNVVGSIRVTFL